MVASVAMNGGNRTSAIRAAWNRPTTNPITIVMAIAATTTPNDGGPAASGERNHSVISLALTTDARATTAPVERSIPPDMITNAAPIASTPNSATRWNSVWTL